MMFLAIAFAVLSMWVAAVADEIAAVASCSFASYQECVAAAADEIAAVASCSGYQECVGGDDELDASTMLLQMELQKKSLAVSSRSLSTSVAALHLQETLALRPHLVNELKSMMPELADLLTSLEAAGRPHAALLHQAEAKKAQKESTEDSVNNEFKDPKPDDDGKRHLDKYSDAYSKVAEYSGDFVAALINGDNPIDEIVVPPVPDIIEELVSKALGYAGSFHPAFTVAGSFLMPVLRALLDKDSTEESQMDQVRRLIREKLHEETYHELQGDVRNLRDTLHILLNDFVDQESALSDMDETIRLVLVMIVERDLHRAQDGLFGDRCIHEKLKGEETSNECRKWHRLCPIDTLLSITYTRYAVIQDLCSSGRKKHCRSHMDTFIEGLEEVDFLNFTTDVALKECMLGMEHKLDPWVQPSDRKPVEDSARLESLRSTLHTYYTDYTVKMTWLLEVYTAFMHERRKNTSAGESDSDISNRNYLAWSRFYSHRRFSVFQRFSETQLPTEDLENQEYSHDVVPDGSVMQGYWFHHVKVVLKDKRLSQLRMPRQFLGQFFSEAPPSNFGQVAGCRGPNSPQSFVTGWVKRGATKMTMIYGCQWWDGKWCADNPKLPADVHATCREAVSEDLGPANVGPIFRLPGTPQPTTKCTEHEWVWPENKEWVDKKVKEQRYFNLCPFGQFFTALTPDEANDRRATFQCCSLPNFPSYFADDRGLPKESVVRPAPLTCESEHKIACGYTGIGQAACKDMQCCWDDQTQGFDPRCYKKRELSTRQLAALDGCAETTCAAFLWTLFPPAEADCLAAGCCWSHGQCFEDLVSTTPPYQIR